MEIILGYSLSSREQTNELGDRKWESDSGYSTSRFWGQFSYWKIKDKHGREDGLVGVEEKVIQSDNK